MMALFGGRKPGPIGIDLSGRSIKAVQLSGRPGAWRIVAAAQVPRKAELLPAAEAERLAGVLERQGFAGRAVALAVPDAALLTAVLDLPPRASGAPVEEIARSEVAHIHRREPVSLELSCWELPAPPRGAERTQAMAVACAHQDAEPLLDAFEGAGFEVCALDARSVAISRACATAWAPEPALTAVLDAGWDSALLSVVAGGVVVYERSLEACEGSRLHGAMVARAGLPAGLADHVLAGIASVAEGGAETVAEARQLIEHHIATVAEQLGLSLSYIAHRYPGLPVGAILVAGEAASLPGLVEGLSSRLEAPARVVAAGDLASGAPARGGSALVGALGLAAGAMEDAA